MKIVAWQLKLDIRHIMASFPLLFRIALFCRCNHGDCLKIEEVTVSGPLFNVQRQYEREYTSVYTYSFINDAKIVCNSNLSYNEVTPVSNEVTPLTSLACIISNSS